MLSPDLNDLETDIHEPHPGAPEPALVDTAQAVDEPLRENLPGRKVGHVLQALVADDRRDLGIRQDAN